MVETTTLQQRLDTFQVSLASEVQRILQERLGSEHFIGPEIGDARVRAARVVEEELGTEIDEESRRAIDLLRGVDRSIFRAEELVDDYLGRIRITLDLINMMDDKYILGHHQGALPNRLRNHNRAEAIRRLNEIASTKFTVETLPSLCEQLEQVEEEYLFEAPRPDPEPGLRPYAGDRCYGK